MWEALVGPEQAAAAQSRYPVSRAVRTAAGVRLRLPAPEAPYADAEPVAPDLEDAYLAVIHQPGGPGPLAGPPRAVRR